MSYNLIKKGSFCSSISTYKGTTTEGTTTWDVVSAIEEGDLLKIVANYVISDYKTLLNGIKLYQNNVEVQYTATSADWNEDNYEVILTVPSGLADADIVIVTDFNTTGMYNIAPSFTVDAQYATATGSFSMNEYSKALAGTTCAYFVDLTGVDSEDEITLESLTDVSGLEVADFITATITGTGTTRKFLVRFTMPSSDVAFKANYKGTIEPTVTHTVTFKAGETTVDTVTVTDGTAIPSAEIPTAPSVAGKEFDYWALDGEEFDFDTLITDDIELDAVYKDAEYTVTFKEGEETVKEVKVGYEDTVSYIDPTTMTDSDGKEFMFWADSNDKEFDFSTPITEDTTLTAYYAQAGSGKWLMSLPNCFVGLKSDVAELPIARVADGTKALALSANAGEEAAYMFNKATLTWIELQHYSVRI